MKSKAILVSIIAIFAIVLTLNVVFASIVDITDVKINGVGASTSAPVIAGEVSDSVPVEVQFVANEDLSKVRVKVSIDGYKEDIEETTPYFHIINGSKYVKRFTIRFPSSMDLDDLSERASLNVEISAKGENSVEEDYEIEFQRQLYSLQILSIDAPDRVIPGSVIAIDVVVQNNGNERLDNTYVKASIPELGIERKVYTGDLEVSYPEESSNDDISDTSDRRIYLTIPANAISGTYNIEVEAYNYDTSVIAKQKIIVSSVESGILPSTTSKTLSIGEETTFDVVLVNPNDRLVVYRLTPDQSKGLIVEAEEPVVALSADSSKTVKVRVKATSSADEGSHIVVVNVDSETGPAKQVSFNVNVEKKATTADSISTLTPVFILTIVLVVIFVVLLIVLIVLLTKKPSETEEFGETSYY
jgi:hypothetical protein